MESNKNDIRHIEIGGISFCGSTVFNLILGSLPGVTAVGESHWLVDMPKKDRKLIEECSNEEYEKHFMQCCYCGISCKNYTQKFRIDLSKTECKEWHVRIATQMNANIVVMSDKRPQTILRLDPKLKNDTVVLFKHPFNASNSYKKRDLKDELFRKSYVGRYETFLSNYKNSGKLIFLQWEEFLEKQEEFLEKVCENLDLKFDKKALRPGWEILKDFHYMSNKARSFLKMDPERREEYDTEKHERFLEMKENSELKEIYHEMRDTRLRLNKDGK